VRFRIIFNKFLLNAHLASDWQRGIQPESPTPNIRRNSPSLPYRFRGPCTHYIRSLIPASVLPFFILFGFSYILKFTSFSTIFGSFIYYLSHSYSIQHVTDYKIGLCLSVCLSVCEHSNGRISWSIFTEIGTDVRTSKRKGQYRTSPSPILSPKIPILGQKVLKTHANIK